MTKSIMRMIVLALIVFGATLIPNVCLAFSPVTYAWEDVDTPFIVKDGHKMKKGDMVINFNINNEINKDDKSIKLHVDYSGFVNIQTKFEVNINKSKNYKVRKTIKINKEHLNSGLNTFIFYIRNAGLDLSSTESPRSHGNLKIKKLSFSEFK